MDINGDDQVHILQSVRLEEFASLVSVSTACYQRSLA
jgi:hypothetical protein